MRELHRASLACIGWMEIFSRSAETVRWISCCGFRFISSLRQYFSQNCVICTLRVFAHLGNLLDELLHSFLQSFLLSDL